MKIIEACRQDVRSIIRAFSESVAKHIDFSATLEMTISEKAICVLSAFLLASVVKDFCPKKK